MSTMTTTAMHWAEKGWLPDVVVRAGIRRLLRERLSELPLGRPTEADRVTRAFVADMDRSPIALVPDKANEQHYEVPYLFEDQGPADWMSRHLFTGGMMPSDDLPLRFQDRMKLVDRWRWNGKHYERTLNAWLANMDRNREAVMPELVRTYGEKAATIWWSRWRIFFMACAELFGFDHGREWWVGHYLFERPV